MCHYQRAWSSLRRKVTCKFFETVAEFFKVTWTVSLTTKVAYLLGVQSELFVFPPPLQSCKYLPVVLCGCEIGFHILKAENGVRVLWVGLCTSAGGGGAAGNEINCKIRKYIILGARSYQEGWDVCTRQTRNLNSLNGWHNWKCLGRSEDNIKRYLRERARTVWFAFVWFGVGSGDGLLWARERSFGCH
jgi:hypothetical protein